MRNRVELILKIACVLLGALLLVQVVRAALRSNPLAKISIPSVPTLAGTNAPADSKGTNAAGGKVLTQSSTNAATNLVKATLTNVSPSQSNRMEPPVAAAPEKQRTNTVAVVETEKPTTNAPVPIAETKAETNFVSKTDFATNGINTNVVLSADSATPGTNGQARLQGEKPGTNSNAMLAAGMSGTNNVVPGTSKKPPGAGSRPNMAMMGMPGMPGMGGGKPLPELAPAIKARIDRVYESELLGQVMRPMPAGLMGIAGNMAFLRASSGQTGLVKEGDSLGAMKLVRIGVNRVLVEEGGEKKELMIFNGYGGESLLSKKETPDETTPK